MAEPLQKRPVHWTSQQILDHTLSLLQENIPLQAQGYCCETEDLFRVLLKAASEQITVESACGDLEEAPDANTVRGYFHEQLKGEQIREWEACCDEAVMDRAPRWMRRRPAQIGLDYHEVPYYGNGEGEEKGFICRGKAKNGTNRFFRVGTAWLLDGEVRVTIAVTWVRTSDTDLQVVQRLLRKIRKRQIPIGRLYMDKEFCSNPLLEWLEKEQIPSIVAVTVRGKEGGTRALLKGRKGYRTTYTFRSNRHRAYTAQLVVARTYNCYRSGEQAGKRKARWCVYACQHVPDPPPKVRREYRRRFGMESGYRMLEAVRARSASKNPVFRFLLITLAMILVNVWVFLRWQLRRMRKEHPGVSAEELTLHRLAAMLDSAVEGVYGRAWDVLDDRQCA